MAQKGYLLEANIVLKDSTGEVVRAAKYEVSTDATSLTASRPGNSLWPSTPTGDLSVVVRYSQTWRDLTDRATGRHFGELEHRVDHFQHGLVLSSPDSVGRS